MSDSDASKTEAIADFCKITGIDAPRAQQYLEAAGWDSNLAMASYFEEADEEAEESMVEENREPVKPVVVSSGASSRIATIASLVNDDDKSEDEHQAFYAGGSERSGQQVLGPGKRKAGNQVVEEMFKAAKSHGAEVVDPSENRPGSTKLKAFQGTGYVLGSEAEKGDMVPDTSNPDQEPAQIWLRVWRTGFTVNDGPMRDYNDPENHSFLESIRKGEIPMELRSTGSGEVHLNIEDHSHEDYVPKKPQVQAFTGAGFRLGSITPPVASVPPTVEPSVVVEKAAEQLLKLDENLPVTNIQIRLASGTRLTMRANHSHTIGDVRMYIVQARPEYSASVFSLMAAYPSRELTDDGTTLEEANLLNAVIVQKLK